MAYVTSNPPRVLVQSIGDLAPAKWQYSSADNAATVAAANYFTNAKDLGMKVNDLVEVLDTGTPLITSHRVTTITATGSTLSAGVTIGNT